MSLAEGERIARDAYGLAAAAESLSGERDRNFLLRTTDDVRYVLKIIDVSTDAASADCLVRVLDALAERRLPVAVPHLFPTLTGAAFGSWRHGAVECRTVLTSYLPGRSLGECVPTPDLLQALGATLGRLDAALCGFFHPQLGRRLAWDVRCLPELRAFAGLLGSVAVRAMVESAADAIRAQLPDIRGMRSQAIHGDCHASNLVVGETGIITGVLDFGDMIHAPVILEPAVTMSELLTDGIVSLPLLSDVLQGFASTQAVTSAEVEVLFDLVIGRHAVTILLHAWRERHDPAGAELLRQTAARAVDSLASLLAGRATLVADWHAAAGTQAGRTRRSSPNPTVQRRHRLLGVGAELFYEVPLHLVRGSDVWLYDADERAYLDVYNNVPHVGHTHPHVVQAIQRQTARLSTNTRYLHGSILDYAERLTASLPAHLDTCLFVNSGSEANDVAWRIAKLASGHGGALVMRHAYHGITDAVGALTPGTGEPQDPWVTTLALPPADGEEAARDAIGVLRGRGFEPAAFFLDSALTSSGILDPPPPWAERVAAPVRAAGGLIVADEVQYGLGRSGSHFWGFERRGLLPDIVTLGKPVGNGYPMGVVIANRELVERFQAKFGFFSTFGGNAVAAAAGLAVLDVMERERLRSNALTMGGYWREQLQTLVERHRCLREVRGHGLLLGVEIQADTVAEARTHTRRIVNRLAAEHAVLTGSEGPTGCVLKLRPPMTFATEHVQMVVAALEECAATIGQLKG